MYIWAADQLFGITIYRLTEKKTFFYLELSFACLDIFLPVTVKCRILITNFTFFHSVTSVRLVLDLLKLQKRETAGLTQYVTKSPNVNCNLSDFHDKFKDNLFYCLKKDISYKKVHMCNIISSS